MISFVTNYDEATRENHRIAEGLSYQSGELRLFEQDATRIRLEATLNASELPLFVMTHGQSRSFSSQNRTPAMDISNLHFLKKRTAFVFACHTSDSGGIGEEARNLESLWFGYTGAISSPDSGSAAVAHFVEVFNFIRNNFFHAQTPTEIASFVNNLREKCEQLREIFFEMSEDETLDNGQFDALASLSCVLHLWDRIRVWLPSESIPYKHPASSTDLFLL